MAEGATTKRVGTAMTDPCISCAGFESLPDDILVDILSRVPIKSLCHCKSVCKRWRNLISHREHRKKLPQTLDGFFCNTDSGEPNYFTVSGADNSFIDPSLSFLRGYTRIDIKDSCNGLLLCRCWKRTDPVTMEYVVCNPATEKWVVVPDSGWSSKVSKVASTPLRIICLGFDPAVSSHFHVFEFISDDIWYIDDPEMDLEGDTDGKIEVVAVYYSRTGVWSLNKNEDHPLWAAEFAMHSDSKSIFFNGVLYLATYYHKVLAIDVEGRILRCIPLPSISRDCEYDPVDVYLSQGQLCLSLVFDEESDDDPLSVRVLEDYNSENRILKYNVNPLHMFGAHYSEFRDYFKVISIHPEHDMIFIVGGEKKTLMSYEMDQTLMSYEMDHPRLRFLSELGPDGPADYNPAYPYVPLFSESLAEDEQ